MEVVQVKATEPTEISARKYTVQASQGAASTSAPEFPPELQLVIEAEKHHTTQIKAYLAICSTEISSVKAVLSPLDWRRKRSCRRYQSLPSSGHRPIRTIRPREYITNSPCPPKQPSSIEDSRNKGTEPLNNPGSSRKNNMGDSRPSRPWLQHWDIKDKGSTTRAEGKGCQFEGSSRHAIFSTPRLQPPSSTPVSSWHKISCVRSASYRSQKYHVGSVGQNSLCTDCIG